MPWKVAVRLVILLTVAFTAGLFFSYYHTVVTPAADSKEPVIFTIQQGQGPRTIAAKLQEEGLLVAQRPFYIYVLATGRRNQFYPGSYTLRRNMNIAQIVAVLSDPTQQEVRFRVLEGWRILDIANEVVQRTTITKEQFLGVAAVSTYEGYLFPDTYSFAKDVTAETIVKKLRENFNIRTKDLVLTNDDVILASIVEREARNDEERPIIAGIYLNRLKIGMALQADPTIQYAQGSWNSITLADYQTVISPYNTYLHKGLPPTPISNPGLKSLLAVLSPTRHDYFYFFHTADGTTHYSKTNAEHNQKKRLYLR